MPDHDHHVAADHHHDDEFYDQLSAGAHNIAAAIDAAGVLGSISQHLGRAVRALDPAGLDLDEFRAAIAAVERTARVYVNGTSSVCTR